jgi:hypothetical protein
MLRVRIPPQLLQPGANLDLMIENAAVFLGAGRKYKNVNVEDTGTEIIVRNRLDGAEFERYSIVEVAKAGMAYDVTGDGPNGLLRLVVQQGCGCSGMKYYEHDESYTGTLSSPRRR